MADHDQQRLIELDANESHKVVFKVSSASFFFGWSFYLTHPFNSLASLSCPEMHAIRFMLYLDKLLKAYH